MSQQRDHVATTVVATFGATLGIETDGVTEATRVDEFDIKSVDLARMISELEDEFDVEIPYMGFRRMKTVSDMIDFVIERLDG